MESLHGSPRREPGLTGADDGEVKVGLWDTGVRIYSRHCDT
ncbi:TPA: hypothetical protein ACGI1P_001471 [Corynebacterium striatum]